MAVNRSVVGSGEVSRNENFSRNLGSGYQNSRNDGVSVENQVHNMLSTRAPSGL